MKNFGSRSTLVTLLLTLTTMLGCSSLNANPVTAQQDQKGPGSSSNGITLNSRSINFGNVPVGKTQAKSVTVSNPGVGIMTITKASIVGSGFAITGPSMPLVLSPKRSANIGVSFTPAASGTKSGIISLTGTTRIRFGRSSGNRRGREVPVDIASSTVSTTFTISVSGVGTTNGQLAVTPATLALGRVKIGGSQTQSVTLANSGTSTVTVKQATVSGRGFKMSGLTFPMKLSPGQKKTFSVTFTPQATGSASGSVAVTSDAPNPVVSVPVTAVAVGPGTLASSPASINFGSVQVGHPESSSATIVNTGTANVTVSQASVSGAGFTMSGPGLPATLAAGQSASFNLTFTPTSGGAASGSLSVSSDASNGVLAIPLTATAVTTGSLTSSPSSLNFGTVQMGTPKTLSATLTNSGGTSVTVSQATLAGAGFTLNGLSLPVALAAGQTKALSVTFTPQASGSATGSISIASNASNTSMTIPLTATVAGAGALSASDSSLDFSTVPVSSTNTLSETLTNTGSSTVTVSQANVSGTGFRITGLTLPLTLAAGQSFTFGTVFAPTTGGSATGSISVVSDAANSTLNISLAGTASVSGQLAISPGALNFGSVIVGQTKSLPASLTASGSSITVTAANLSTSEFAVSGLSLPVTLAAGKSLSFTISFTPQSSGAASASASFVSNASNSSLQQSLSGNATAAPQHSVALSWTPSSTGSVVGYNIYRGGKTGGPYSQINAMNADTTFTDSTVQSGQTYFYVTTAVDGTGKESSFSNQTQATIPTP